jgi:protein-S-isoprenylcysteine O-methyltransferase Ste14
MTLAIFLNIIGLCLGFVSAIFFAIGALTMTPAKIQKVAASYWDANQHWGDSIADQRADYIVGALLLLLAFLSQLLATLVHSTFEPSLLQPFGYAIAEIAAALALLFVCSVLLRNAIAKSTKSQVRQIQAAAIAAQEAEIAKRSSS